MNDRSGVVALVVAALFSLALVAPAFGAQASGQRPVKQQSGDPQTGAAQNGGSADGGEEGADPTDQFPGGKRMTATGVSGPPVIDGLVDDDVWELAEVVTDFLQREPDNAEPASERTEVRIIYDEEAIYLGFVMYDDPNGIVAQDLRRDSRMRTDDTIAVLFDTFHDHRNGFLFRVNPLGTRYDALLRNERQVNSDWNEKWEAATQVTEQGWEAEMAIPWKALRFRPGSHIWGVDFKREIRRRNEEDNWSNYRRGYQFNSISEGGHLLGLDNLKLTERFRLKPYVTGSGAQFNATEQPFTDGDGDIGIENFKVQLTSNLTADFTVNTDFAQVEDDNERVNLTRFSLFFPEKREFFLESANNFAFGSSGGGGFDGGEGGGFGGGRGVNLYHSRNIGLRSGEAIPILYGAKMTGKVGDTTLGLLNVQTRDSEFGPGENFTALRFKQDIFERSSIGGIFTNVQDGLGGFNRVGGLDASFRFYDYLSFSGFVATVQDDDVEGNPIAGRFGAGWNSDRFDLSGSYEVIDPDFDSDLGYIRRKDIATQSYRAGWSPRPDFLGLRQVRLNASLSYVTDTDGLLQNRGQGVSAWFTFQSGDSVSINLGRDFERLDHSFEVSDGVLIEAGDYTTNDWSVHFNTYSARRASVRLRVNGGGFWDGTRTSVSPGGTIRFNEKFSISPSWSYNTVDVKNGSFSTQTVSIRSTYNFNERWLTNSLIQYNSVSGQMSAFARLNYIYRDGDDFFLVYKQTRRFMGEYDGESDRQLLAKLTYSFDF